MSFSEIKKQMESQGIRFTGAVSEAELDRIENTYGIVFPKALRAFYKEGIPLSKNEYDFPAWTDFSEENIRKIRERIEAPRSWLLRDVRNGYWIAPWGCRPDTEKEAVDQVSVLADKAPKLIPVFSHRYIPLIDGLDDPPVISAVGQDIVFYGSDLADYLEREFAGKTGAFDLPAEIPFWGDIINANRTEFERKNARRTMFTSPNDHDMLPSADSFAHLIETAKTDLKKAIPEEYTQAVAFETASGNVYHAVIVNALTEEHLDEKALLEQMKAQNDTQIVKIVCLWAGEHLDMPSYAFKMLICETDAQNEDAQMLLLGENRLIIKTIFETLAPKDQHQLFERRVMLEIIKETPEYEEKLLRQYQNSKITLRRFTGHGFFTDFFVSDPDATLGEGVNLELGSVRANLNDMKHGVGFILFVRNGLITCLEGYAYDEPFPDAIYRYEIPYNG